MCPRHMPPQSTHFADVLHATHSMDDAARCEEQQGFEEGVRHEMKYAGGVCAGAACKKHVSKLADGGVRQNLFDIGLDQTNRSCIDGGEQAHNRDDQQRSRRVVVQ